MRFLCDGHVTKSLFWGISGMGPATKCIDTKGVTAISASESHVTLMCTETGFVLDIGFVCRRIWKNRGGQ